MDLKTLFLSGIKAAEMDNYGHGIQNQHGVSVSDNQLKVKIEFVPAHIISEKHTSNETLVVFHSERTIPRLIGSGFDKKGFAKSEIKQITDFIVEKVGTDGIVESWNINDDSETLSFIIKHVCSQSFIKAFESYSKLNNVFHFSKAEKKLSDNFSFVWQCNSDLFLKFAAEIKK